MNTNEIEHEKRQSIYFSAALYYFYTLISPRRLRVISSLIISFG